LTTSELGSTICGPEHAQAGTQRLQRALHHEGWKSQVIEEVLWEQAESRVRALEARGETPLVVWESSVLEKPESTALEGLGNVRSSRVKRLARTRKGLFNRPSGMEVERARVRMGKLAGGGSGWQATGRCDALVGSRQGSGGAAATAAAEFASAGGLAMETTSAPCV